ncbi:TPA: hypothetical protein I9089_003126 [Clostridium perfringens]|nr:hypothetical protein [Clostridium perfringens]
MQNDNKNFLYEILNEVSKLEFYKIYNLLFAIVGLICPSIPIIYLYRQDVIKKFDLIGTLIIAITINSIIALLCRIIVTSTRTKSIQCKKYKCRIINIKLKKSITKLNENIGTNLNNKNIKKYLKKIKIKSINLKNTIKNLDNEIEELSKNLTFIEAILYNIMFGAMILLFKVLSILGILYVNFEIVLKSCLAIYSFMIIHNVILSFYKSILEIRLSKLNQKLANNIIS